MKIIDGHCDVLWKMYEKPNLNFYDPQIQELDVSAARMSASGVKIQFFAIYLSESIQQPDFNHYLEYINIFYQKIVSKNQLLPIRNQEDLQAVMQSNAKGAILTLEGADAIRNNPLYTRTLYQLGVRMIGVTWNYANWAADGILEPRQGGFSKKGKTFIKDCNEMGMIIDVSHLSVKSFWDVADLSQKPFVATHSNAKAICNHPRNLDDDQIRMLILKKGRIGLTFVPWFVNDKGAATIDHLIKHVEHMCELGGVRHVVLGSDFDGIDQWIPGLEHAGQYDNLAQTLSRYYKDEWVEGFLYGNWLSFLQNNLPAW